MDATSPITSTTNSMPDLDGLTIREHEGGSPTDSALSSPDPEPTSRPASPKRSFESTPDAFVQALRAEVNQQRPRSPYSRNHLRSYSAASTPSAPPMARARSLPLYEPRVRGPSPGHSPVRPSSPLRPPPAARSSPRHSMEDARPTTLAPSFMEDIAENQELNIQPRPAPTLDPSAHMFYPHTAHTIPRSNSGRRRPVSPLHSLSTLYATPPSPRTSLATLSAPAVPSRSPSSTPPPVNAARFNESYPGTASQSIQPSTQTNYPSTPSISYSSASSMPSTPTSFRSRSPSISSLDTIPDSPEAEAEAQAVAASEAVQIAKLRAAAEAEESDEDKKGGRRRLGAVDPAKRKRWSVCGGERRDTLEMETIWED